MCTFTIENGVITNCRGYEGDTLVIPETDSEGNPVVEIEFLGFKFYDEECKIRTIIIPNTIKKIASWAFSDCRTLTEIHIPSSVESIDGAFALNCESLTTITVDPANEHYDSRDNCNAVICKKTNTLVQGCRNTIIPNSVEKIGPLAFSRCYQLKNIFIPNSVEMIGPNAFERCYQLESMFIPSSVCEIGKEAFQDCDSLATLYLSDNIKKIGSGAIDSCHKLRFLRIPSDVEIVDDAFGYSVITHQFIIATTCNKAIDLVQRFHDLLEYAHVLFAVEDDDFGNFDDVEGIIVKAKRNEIAKNWMEEHWKPAMEALKNKNNQ